MRGEMQPYIWDQENDFHPDSQMGTLGKIQHGRLEGSLEAERVPRAIGLT